MRLVSTWIHIFIYPERTDRFKARKLIYFGFGKAHNMEEVVFILLLNTIIQFLWIFYRAAGERVATKKRTFFLW
jgi:adenylate kinase family enzyme